MFSWLEESEGEHQALLIKKLLLLYAPRRCLKIRAARVVSTKTA